MKDFESFIGRGDVRTGLADGALAKSLIDDMKDRIEDAFKMSVEEFPKAVFENVYDALRDFCDALLALEGYKSYSHEASISYLLKRGFDIVFAMQLDRFRQKRNGSKYYGVKISLEEANEIKKFYELNSNKIYKALEDAGLA